VNARRIDLRHIAQAQNHFPPEGFNIRSRVDQLLRGAREKWPADVQQRHARRNHLTPIRRQLSGDTCDRDHDDSINTALECTTNNKADIRRAVLMLLGRFLP